MQAALAKWAAQHLPGGQGSRSWSVHCNTPDAAAIALKPLISAGGPPWTRPQRCGPPADLGQVGARGRDGGSSSTGHAVRNPQISL